MDRQTEDQVIDEILENGSEETENEATEDIEEVVETSEVVEDVVTPEINIPENWEQDLKDFIGSIEDPTGKQAVFNKIKNLDSGYQKKFKDFSEKEKAFQSDYESFQEKQNAYKSYEDLHSSINEQEMSAINQQFGSSQQYFNHLMELDRSYSQNPVGTVLQLMNQGGIDINTLQQYQNNPAMQQSFQMQSAQQSSEQKLRQELDDLKATINDKFQANEEQKFIADHLAIKDESGNQKYPHMNNESVINAMGYISQQNPEMDFDSIYNESLYMVPDIRNNILSQNKAAEIKIAEAQKTQPPKQIKSKVSSSQTKRQLSENEMIDEILNDFDI